jgi:small-conductance mechanosensitive channel
MTARSLAEPLFDPNSVAGKVVDVLQYEVALTHDSRIRVSLLSLIIAVAILVLTWRLSRAAQRVLGNRLLGRVPIDSGLAYTIQRLVHYVFVTIGVLVAIGVGLGVDLTSITVVVTALSVGLGLGLREIAGDVAAGFVLLFERPVRVGDRVRLPGDLDVEGIVAAIDLRTTKIRRLDSSTVIVPNSRITNEKCVNWSYAEGATRVAIPVALAHGADLQVALDALVEAATGVANVAPDPPPAAWIVELGETAVRMVVHVWIADLAARPQVVSDVSLCVDRLLRERGIELVSRPPVAAPRPASPDATTPAPEKREPGQP